MQQIKEILKEVKEMVIKSLCVVDYCEIHKIPINDDNIKMVCSELQYTPKETFIINYYLNFNPNLMSEATLNYIHGLKQ